MHSNQLEGQELAGFTRRFFGFGFLQYFIDYNRRTVHDRIAETIVIKVNKTPASTLVD
jgi:hypothetical protein